MALQNSVTSRKALVAFGSETGTAQDVAEEIGRLVKRLHFVTRVSELDDVGLNDFARFDLVVVVISTTGQGDLPKNAQSFWTKLRSSKLKPGVLSRLKCSSFGIGDSSYPNFNWAHRKLSNRLLQLGAHYIIEAGESDEQHAEGLDGIFLPWSSKLRARLLMTYPLPSNIQPIPDTEFLEPEWELGLTSSSMSDYDGTSHSPSQTSDDMVYGGPLFSRTSSANGDKRIQASVLSNMRLTPQSHWQDVRLIEFSTPHAEYGPGDVLTIFPKNAEEDVDEVIKIMHWDHVADHPLRFIATGIETSSGASTVTASVPTFPISRRLSTLRSVIRNNLDLNAIPRRSFFGSLAHFTNDETQKERLLEFTKPELIDELYDYTTRPRRSIIEVLQEFDTVKIPWKWVTSVFPHIHGRQFSIASGGALKYGPSRETRIQLLVAIVKYRTVIKKIRRGLCTRYLSELKNGTSLEAILSKSGMKISLNKPAVMIGPGTGVAPLRSMIHERLLHQPSPITPPMLLFFGNRYRQADFFFSDEWVSAQMNGYLETFAAFSRDQATKIYVQDVIRMHSPAVNNLLQQGATIYVCGSSGKMPQAVRAALIDVIKEEEKVSKEEAESRLGDWEKKGRYQQETW